MQIEHVCMHKHELSPMNNRAALHQRRTALLARTHARTTSSSELISDDAARDELRHRYRKLTCDFGERHQVHGTGSALQELRRLQSIEDES